MKKIFYPIIFLVTTTVQTNGPCWSKLSVSGLTTLAIKTVGTLWAWGWNGRGQLGDGSFTDSNIPIQIGTDNNWALITANNLSSMALNTNN